MRKLILLLVILPVLAWAGPGYIVCDCGSVPSAPAGFCTGGTLFCADFETQDMIDWDYVPPSGSEDCDGFDADGDWCDYYTGVVKNGSHSFGIQGSGATYYFREALSSTASEFYAELWYQNNADGIGDTRLLIFEDASNNAVITVSRDNNEGVNAICNGTTFDPGNSHIQENTWVHIGLYYKEETGAGNNDGIVRVWLETDGDGFEAVEMLINQTSVDTVSNDAAKIRMSGPYTGKISYRDDVKVTAGAPSWPTS